VSSPVAVGVVSRFCGRFSAPFQAVASDLSSFPQMEGRFLLLKGLFPKCPSQFPGFVTEFLEFGNLLPLIASRFPVMAGRFLGMAYQLLRQWWQPPQLPTDARAKTSDMDVFSIRGIKWVTP
jgi:hypothetical protein